MPLPTIDKAKLAAMVTGQPAIAMKPAGYPAGAVGYFRKKDRTWYIAIPPSLASPAPYIEAGSQPGTETPPQGVQSVSFWQYQKLTRPWYRRVSTLIAGGTILAALMGGGGYILVKRRKLKQLTN